MEVEGLEKKDFEFTVKWTVDASIALEEGTQSGLDTLREVGEAEITDIKLVDKK